MVPLSQAMQKLRVSVVQYLNTAPLVWGFLHGPQQGQAELSFTVPSGCAEALRTGAADVGIIPSIAYQTIPGLKIIPGVALVAHGSVESVLLVSRVPAAEARTVALDQSSQTSAALVRILFARHWKTEPHYVSAVPDLEAMLARADAALLIGDPQEVTDKILFEHELFRMDRFLIQFSVGTMPHAKMLRAIELFGTKVAPAVRQALASG